MNEGLKYELRKLYSEFKDSEMSIEAFCFSKSKQVNNEISMRDFRSLLLVAKSLPDETA